MHDAWFSGNYEEAIKINERLSHINNLLFIEANPCPVKFAASILGLCENEIRLPLTQISKENETEIKEEIKRLSLSFS